MQILRSVPKTQMLFEGGVKWLLRDDFNDTRAAGSVNGTPATPGPGTRTVVDTDNKLSIGSGALNLAPNSAPAWGNPGYWLDAITRTAGRLTVFGKLNVSTVNTMMLGFDTDQAGTPGDNALYPGAASGNIYTRNNGVNSAVVGVVVVSTDYYFALVQRSSGVYYFAKGGVFTNWTLLWIASTGNTGTTYPAVTTNLASFTLDFLRIPDELWLPSPLAYDTFTDDNGMSLDAHSSDTSGPDSQVVTSRSWTEDNGDWDIQSNKARAPAGAPGAPGPVASCEVGESDVIVDATVNMSTGGAGLAMRVTDKDNTWFVEADSSANQLKLIERDTASNTTRASIGVTVNTSTDYDIRAICDGQNIYAFLDGGNKITYASATFNQTETAHGLRNNNNAGTFTYDNFLIFPRGTGSGFAKLNRYIS